MKLKKSLISIFKDEKGNIVIGQSPNLSITLFILFKAAEILTSGNLSTFSGNLATAFLFVWAYLEISEGANTFRKLLGAVVMVYIISSDLNPTSFTQIF